jgi:hypothetical protein
MTIIGLILFINLIFYSDEANRRQQKLKMKRNSVRFLATEAVYKCNIEARSRNHFCSGKTINIT